MQPWIATPDAPLPKLEEQLKGARAAHEEAVVALAAARAEFDRAPTPKAERAVRDAQEAMSSASEHVQRAERLLQAARDRAASDRQSSLEARRKELSAQLGRKQELQAPSLQREIDALLLVAEAQAARLAVEKEFASWEHEITQINTELDPDYRPPMHYSAPSISRAPVKDALHNVARKMNAEDPRRAYLLKLASDLG